MRTSLRMTLMPSTSMNEPHSPCPLKRNLQFVRNWLASALSLLTLLCLLAPSIAAAPADLPASRPSGPQVNLLAMGDWGEGAPAQAVVARTLAEYVSAQAVPFQAMLLAGDNFYVPLRSVDDPSWKTLFEQMYDPRKLDMPFYAALGNHDYEGRKLTIELDYARLHPESRWKLPARWYRIDLPREHPLVTVLMLDSNHDVIAPAQWNQQINWLKEQLASDRAPWTICCAHHPLYSNGFAADNGILQHDWGALFDRYRVDFYLCGHEHNLQHLEIADKPTSFVIAGGGGAHSHPMLRDNRGPFSRSIYGFAHFQITPEEAVVRYIGCDGKPVHVFQRSKAGETRVLMTTPSDRGAPKPLKAILGLYDKANGPATQPATEPATAP